MTAPNYPNNPTIGQQFVVGNNTFQWDGEKWKALSNADNSLRSQLAAPDSTVLVGGVAAGQITQRLADAEQRIVDLPAEVDAAGTAANLVNQHNSDANAHPALSAFISAEADRAEVAVDVAMTAGWVYPTVAAGEADRVAGNYFWVVSSESDYILDLYLMGATTAIAQNKRTVSSKYIDGLLENVFHNTIVNGDYVLGDPIYFQAAHTAIDLTNQTELLDRGYTKAVQRITTGNQFISYQSGVEIPQNTYVFVCLLNYLAGNGANSEMHPEFYPQDAGGGLGSRTIHEVGVIALSDNVELLWGVYQITGAGNEGYIIGARSADDTNGLLTGFCAYEFNSQPNAKQCIAAYLAQDKTRLSARKLAEALTADKASESQLHDAIDKLLDTALNNFTNGDMLLGDPELFSGSSIVDATQEEILNRGVTRGLLYQGSVDFIIYDNVESLQGKWVFVAYTQYSTDPENLGNSRVNIFIGASEANGSLEGFNPDTVNKKQITKNVSVRWSFKQIANATTTRLLFGSNESLVDPNYLFITDCFAHVSDNEITAELAEKYLNDYILKQKIRGIATKLANNATAEAIKATLRLNGPNTVSSITTSVKGYEVERTFRPFDDQLIDASAVFNFRTDYIDGVVVRDGGDDVPPILALNTTIGGNHGYIMQKYSATSHGKTAADVGSIYKLGGTQYVIMSIIDSNSLYMAFRSSNSDAYLAGTFNHVSGGTNTASFSATTSGSARQWCPAYQNRSMKVFVDGVEVIEKTKQLTYKDKAVFVESYDVLERSDIIEWIVANGAGGNYQPSGLNPAFTMTNSYEFDVDGNCTIYQDWLFLKTIPFSDILGLQAMQSIFDRYYVPKTLPFTHEGFPVDYANIESARITTDNGLNDVYFDVATRCEPNGLLVDRAVALTPQNNCLAMGFLPVQDAGITERRNNVTGFAMQIAGPSGKIYARVVNKGGFTASAGEYYSTIAYRNVFPKPAGRTTAYPVRTRGADYFYCDWHNVVKFDRVELPTDYAGRDFEVVEARNATLYNRGLTGSIAVDVSCSGDYAYLILKVVK